MSHYNPNLRSEVIRSEVIKDIRVLCTHLFDGGHTCASPALRGETFCYYHHPTRRPLRETRAAWRIARRSFSIPTPASHEQTLDALTYVLQAIIENRVKLTHARRILYALQQVSTNLQKSSGLSHGTPRRAPICKTAQPASYAQPQIPPQPPAKPSPTAAASTAAAPSTTASTAAPVRTTQTAAEEARAHSVETPAPDARGPGNKTSLYSHTQDSTAQSAQEKDKTAATPYSPASESTLQSPAPPQPKPTNQPAAFRRTIPASSRTQCYWNEKYEWTGVYHTTIYPKPAQNEQFGSIKNWHPPLKPAILKSNHLYHVARPT